MKLAFYKADKGNFLDKLIGFWTRPNFFSFNLGYSHVELVFDDNLCFSSSPRDNGCRYKYISDLYTSGNWDIFEVKTKYTISELKVKCNLEQDKKYDWLCIILSDIIPFNIQNPKKWTCSELCASFLYDFNYAASYSPNSFLHYINKTNKLVKGK
jgi:hypothetical protein